MKKRLIEYIREMNDCNYSDLQDYFDDQMHNPPEVVANRFGQVLIYIQNEEMKENSLTTPE